MNTARWFRCLTRTFLMLFLLLQAIHIQTFVVYMSHDQGDLVITSQFTTWDNKFGAEDLSLYISILQFLRIPVILDQIKTIPYSFRHCKKQEKALFQVPSPPGFWMLFSCVNEMKMQNKYFFGFIFLAVDFFSIKMSWTYRGIHSEWSNDILFGKYP